MSVALVALHLFDCLFGILIDDIGQNEQHHVGIAVPIMGHYAAHAGFPCGFIVLPQQLQSQTFGYGEENKFLWVQPYLDAAIRSGLVSGWQQESFDMNAPVTGAETAVALQNALDLSAGHEEIVYGEEVPSWAATSLAVMAANGVELEAATPMTRGQIAQVLYQVSRMAIGAPGVMVFSMQK